MRAFEVAASSVNYQQLKKFTTCQKLRKAKARNDGGSRHGELAINSSTKVFTLIVSHGDEMIFELNSARDDENKHYDYVYVADIRAFYVTIVSRAIFGRCAFTLKNKY